MKKPKPYFPIVSCMIVMATMLWLTVSTPFIYASDKLVKTEIEQKSGDTDENNPLTGTTEEKCESNTNSLSEYLSDLLNEFPVILEVKMFKRHNADIYLAFRPELTCPPPKHTI